MCDGPGVPQTAMQQSRTSFALREYWRSDAGRARREAMRAANREARLARREEMATSEEARAARHEKRVEDRAARRQAAATRA